MRRLQASTSMELSTLRNEFNVNKAMVIFPHSVFYGADRRFCSEDEPGEGGWEEGGGESGVAKGTGKR